MNEAIRIVIADDHPLFRQGVATSLSNADDIIVVGQAESGEDACQLVAKLLPDIVLLDITMPGAGGISAVQQINNNWPIVKTIMLTVSEEQDDLMRALKAGAKGYVLKGVSAKELETAVRSVASGDVYISPMLASGILFEMTHLKQPAEAPINYLTDREKEILKLVSQGLTNREIGEKLHLAEKTIKHYMTNVLNKLEVRSRVEAALLAQKHNLL